MPTSGRCARRRRRSGERYDNAPQSPRTCGAFLSGGVAFRGRSPNGPRPRTSLKQTGRPVTCTAPRANRGSRIERHRSRGLSGIGISRIRHTCTVANCARAGAVGVEGIYEGHQSHLVTGKLHSKVHLVCAAESRGFQERPRARRTCPARETLRRGYTEWVPGIVQRAECPGLGFGIVHSGIGT